ncbi:hypothetical protein ACFDTO_33290 [Microbacteriaceae bacterium 4G12]
MGYYVSALFTIILLTCVVTLAMLWSKVAPLLEQKVFIRFQPITRKILLITMTMTFELGAVWVISRRLHWSFVDSLFMGSFLFLTLVWMTGYNRTSLQNQATAVSRYYGGKDDVREIKVFRPSSHPFAIGTFIFALIGIITSFVYYIPYFV